MLRVLVMTATMMLMLMQPSFAFQTYECSPSASATSVCSSDKNECPFATNNSGASEVPPMVIMVNRDMDSDPRSEVFVKSRDDRSLVKHRKGTQTESGFFVFEDYGQQEITYVGELLERVYEDNSNAEAILIPWVVLYDSGSVIAAQLRCQALHQ